MNKIKKILACIDLSQYSLMTLEYAVELAKGAEIQIIVFNVINQRDINGVEMVSNYFPNKISVEGYVKELKKDRHGMIKSMIKENLKPFSPKDFQEQSGLGSFRTGLETEWLKMSINERMLYSLGKRLFYPMASEPVSPVRILMHSCSS